MVIPDLILSIDFQKAAMLVALGLLGYLLCLVTYRLFFHPLRHVPGPFLARLTYWYQIYYDAFCGGIMPRQMPGLHLKYGPVVRIAPDRVHINDPEFYKR